MPRTKTRGQIKREVNEEVKRRLNDELPEETLEEPKPVKGRVPGQVVRGIKTTWTRHDVESRFPLCEFTPGETIPVTYNGVKYQLIEGVAMIAPTIIRDIYLQHQRAQRDAGRTLPSSGFETTIDIGAGGLPPE